MEGGKPKCLSSPVSATSLTKNVAASLNAPKSASASSMAKKAVASLNVPETVSARSLTKTAAASLNSPKSVSTSSTTKNVAASLNAAKSASASSLSKKAAPSSLNEPKTGERKRKNVSESDSPASASIASGKNNDVVTNSAKHTASGKKPCSSRSRTVILDCLTGTTKVIVEEDNSPVKEQSSKGEYKKQRAEDRRRRRNIPKNPYNCPDFDEEWSSEDETEYINWLEFEKRNRRHLSRDEESYLAANRSGEVVRFKP